jgi:hypothetical protein
MAETWLGTNRRALALGMVVPVLLGALTGTALVWSVMTARHWSLQLVLLLVSAAPMWMLGELLYALGRPRVAYDDGELLVYLEPTRATRIPIDIVEVFFLGQGPGVLPPLRGREPETQNVIVRLAEAATEWKQRDVRPALGQWCESYITIRGSWCEPITPGLMRRLNQRLAEVQRERKAAAAEVGEHSGARG